MIITVFSMSVVFAGLIFLAMLISVLKAVSVEKEEVKKETITSIEAKRNTAEKAEEIKTDDGELVAVIAAAVAASLGANIPDINIKSIKRLQQSSTTWAAAGRNEQIYGKL